jgi:hypothetical protein
MPEGVSLGDAERKVVTQSRDLSCSPARKYYSNVRSNRVYAIVVPVTSGLIGCIPITADNGSSMFISELWYRISCGECPQRPVVTLNGKVLYDSLTT